MSSPDYSQAVKDIIDGLGDSPTPDAIYHAVRSYSVDHVVAAAAAAAKAGGGGGGSQVIETAEIVLTNAQIKALHTTPITLVAPDDASHVPILSDVTLVIDDTHGLYVDPDGGYNAVIGYGPDPTLAAAIIMDQITLDDVGMGAPGAGVWPAWAGVHGFKNFTAGWYWGTVGPLAPFGGVATPTGSIMIGKSGAANYTGGGTGNTLTVRLQYSQVKVTV